MFRRLDASDPSPVVKNPVQCLHLYDTVAWRIAEGVYPIFLKDSLLNTNTAIDLSAFSQIASAIRSQRDATEDSLDESKMRNLEVSAHVLANCRPRRMPGGH